MSMFPIASTTLSSAGSVTFSNIPQTFTHLQLRVYSRSTFSGQTASVFIRFNGDGGSNYAFHNIWGDGASVLSNGSTGQTVGWLGNNPAATNTANVFGATIADILHYSASNRNKVVKSISGYDASGNGQIYFASTLWLNTAAITSLLVVSGGGADFVAGSRVDLYGVATSFQTGA